MIFMGRHDCSDDVTEELPTTIIVQTLDRCVTATTGDSFQVTMVSH